MQCAVVVGCLHYSSLWPPGEVFSRVTSVARRSGGFGILSGRKWGLGQKVYSISSSRLGFLGSGLVGIGELNGNLRQKWKERGSMCSDAAAGRRGGSVVHASLMVDPAAVWIVRTAVFYVLLETGIAVRRQPQASDSSEESSNAKGLLAWIQNHFGEEAEQKRNKELAKVRSKWHASTKGTLLRRYRVPSKAGGRKLLSAISSLLADDDTFRDVATHKGCQIRRENAHAESVCCHNVRALFDELPTPHLVVEITVFPAGPITAAHYEKADKIEKVLRTGTSI